MEVVGHSSDGEEEPTDVVTTETSGPDHCNKWRMLIAFAFFGLTNNFGYVVMLSAARDLLDDSTVNAAGNSSLCNVSSSELVCNEEGTGWILLADIGPSLFMKVTAPFFMHLLSYNFKFVVLVSFSAASCFVVGFAADDRITWLIYLGVVLCSISCGAGEVFFLSFTSLFDQKSVAAWSVGTGIAGVTASLSYAAMRVALSLETTILITVVVPVIEAICFYCVLDRPAVVREGCITPTSYVIISAGEDPHSDEKPHLSMGDRMRLIKPLLKYMIPLCLVYFAEYFINQALFEILYVRWSCSWLSIAEQYRWFQTLYQIGVLFSRSSVVFFTVGHLWVLPILQFGLLALLTAQIYLQFIQTVWIIFALILIEGLFGGLAYANTFYKISQEVDDDVKEYSMGVASMGDTIGIVAAALASISAHNGICRDLGGA